MKVALLVLLAGLFDPKPTVSLYIVNKGGKKELIARFYQRVEVSLPDCKALAELWSPYPTSCEVEQ